MQTLSRMVLVVLLVTARAADLVLKDGGNEARISYHGPTDTLTVPQHCTESKCTSNANEIASLQAKLDANTDAVDALRLQLPGSADWRLALLAHNGALQMEPTIAMRQKYVRASKVAFAWKAGLGPASSIDDYDNVVKVTGIGGDRPAWNGELRPVPTGTLEGRQCADTDAFVEVEVECLKGTCDMPSKMYLGAKSGATCYGKAFGLVAPPDGTDPQCDYLAAAGGAKFISQGYTAVYLMRQGHLDAGLSTVKTASGSASIPGTSAMFYWG